MTQDATLMMASSEHDSDLYYETGFLAPDPFVYVKIRGRKYLLVSDLELDRARSSADVNTVAALSRYTERAKAAGKRKPTTLDALAIFLREKKVKRLVVPPGFGVRDADALRRMGFRLAVGPEPFCPSRITKSADDIRKITQVLRFTEAAMHKGMLPIREGKIRGCFIYHHGLRVTSEMVKGIVNGSLLEAGLMGDHTIISSGEQCCSPHDEGSGPLLANATIIFDVFPRSSATRYYADITRTFFKGKASPELRKMYRDVRHAQELAIERLRQGSDGREADGAIREFFEGEGYFSGRRDGRMQGFFHGTGHGVGLDVHEPPRIARESAILKAGMVVTVEPGLYYPGLGGIRLEDVVVIGKGRARNITNFPKVFEMR